MDDETATRVSHVDSRLAPSNVHNLHEKVRIDGVALSRRDWPRVSTMASHDEADIRPTEDRLATTRAAEQCGNIAPTAATKRSTRTLAALLPAICWRIGRDFSVLA